MSTFVFSIPEMMCETCRSSVARCLDEYQQLPNTIPIEHYQINIIQKTLSVTISGSYRQEDLFCALQPRLESAGYTCLIKQNTPSSSDLLPHLFLGGVGLSMAILILFSPILFAGLGVMAHFAFMGLAVILTLVVGAPFIINAFRKVTHQEYSMDLLLTMSAIIAISVSIASMVVPGLPMMLDVGLWVFAFRHIGLAIRDGIQNAMGMHVRAQDIAPAVVRRKKTRGEYEFVPLSELMPGDVIQIGPEQPMLPVDGWYEEDEPAQRLMSIREINGQSKPQWVDRGAFLLAGMILEHDQSAFDLRVAFSGYTIQLSDKVPTDQEIPSNTLGIYCADHEVDAPIYLVARHSMTQNIQHIQIDDERMCLALRQVLGQLPMKLPTQLENQVYGFAEEHGFKGRLQACSHLRRVDESNDRIEAKKTPMKTMTDRILDYFVPGVLILALLVGLITVYFFPVHVAIRAVLAVLNWACPCSLGLIVPLALSIGMYKIPHVVFNKTIEDADGIDCVVLDLHGTLTEGQFAVERCECLSDETESDCLAYLAALEKEVPHSVGQTIYQYAQSRYCLSKEVTQREIKTQGVFGVIDGVMYCVGNADMMCAHGLVIDESEDAYDTVIYLAACRPPQHAYTLLFKLFLNDPLREDAQRMIQLLPNVRVCTGANKETARRYAKKLGVPLSEVTYGRTNGVGEQSKSAYIAELQAQGLRVMMVGDALNDSEAMTQSDFSVAMKHPRGNESVQKRASAVIEHGRLESVADILIVARQTTQNIQQNLMLSWGYNAAALPVTAALSMAIGCAFNPGICAALMSVQMGVILLNAYRFKMESVPKSASSEVKESYSIIGAALCHEHPKKSLALDPSPNIGSRDGRWFDHVNRTRMHHVPIGSLNEVGNSLSNSFN